MPREEEPPKPPPDRDDIFAFAQFAKLTGSWQKRVGIERVLRLK